jgi:hypothetical protein
VIPSEPLNPRTLVEAKVLLEANYGVEYDDRKFMMLSKYLIDKGWSEERFKRTFDWFIQNKKFSAWTMADWFDFGIKLYPFAWVRQYCHENGLREDVFIQSLDCYNVGGVRMYKMKDGIDLPFPSGDTVMPMPYKGSY